VGFIERPLGSGVESENTTGAAPLEVVTGMKEVTATPAATVLVEIASVVVGRFANDKENTCELVAPFASVAVTV
jgi:hypothetical protein